MRWKGKSKANLMDSKAAFLRAEVLRLHIECPVNTSNADRDMVADRSTLADILLGYNESTPLCRYKPYKGRDRSDPGTSYQDLVRGLALPVIIAEISKALLSSTVIDRSCLSHIL